MAQTVDVDGNPVETASADDVTRELLGDEAESTSAESEPEDAEIPEDPDQVSLEVSEGEDDEAEEEIEAAAEETGKDTSDEGLAKLKAHIDKTYNGDVDAYIKGWHENNARMKQFSEELTSIRESLQSGKFNAQSEESDEESEVEVSADADIAFHNENIQSLEQEAQQANQYSQHYLQEAGKLSLDIKELQGELKHADESEVPRLESKLASLESKVENLMGKSSDSAKEAKSLQKQLKSEQRALKAAERQAEQERLHLRNQRQQQQETEQKIRTEAGSNFSTTANALFDKYGVPEGARQAQFDTLKALVSHQIRSLGPNAPLQDIKALTQAAGEAYFESLKSITNFKFGKASKTKLKPASKQNRNVKPSTSSSAPMKKHRREMSQADWDKRAAEVARYYDSL